MCTDFDWGVNSDKRKKRYQRLENVKKGMSLNGFSFFFAWNTTSFMKKIEGGWKYAYYYFIGYGDSYFGDAV